MATTLKQSQLYPLSTENSDAIPLDVIRPTGIIRLALSAPTTDLVIPEEVKIAAFYSKLGCFIHFGLLMPNPPISNTYYPDALFIPPGVIITSVIPSVNAKVVPLSADGELIIQGIYKWAGVGLDRQVNRIL